MVLAIGANEEAGDVGKADFSAGRWGGAGGVAPPDLPGASGNPRDEFGDLVPMGMPEDAPTAVNKSDAFWSMYYQAHSPRLWRMPWLLTLSSRPGGAPKEDSEQE